MTIANISIYKTVLQYNCKTLYIPMKIYIKINVIVMDKIIFKQCGFFSSVKYTK